MDTLFDFGSFVIQGINFLIIALVLRKFFFIPYMKYLSEESLKRAELAKNLSHTAELVDSAKKEADAIREDARTEAKNIASSIVENAKNEASEIAKKADIDAENARKKGFSDVEQERKMMADVLKEKVLSVAIHMNEKLFGKNDAHVDFLKKNTPSIEL